MILTEILEKNAKEFPDKIALVMRMGYRSVSLTYKEVYDLSLKIACFLEKQGLKKGDKVLILAPNSPYWICVWWGSILGGYVPVPLNIQSTGEMIRKIALQTEAKIIFKDLHFKQELPVNLKSYDIEFVKELVSDIKISDFQKPLLKENDLVELMYTSGTTGDPKGVMLTHKNISSNLEAINKVAPLKKTDKFLSILPLSHIFEQVIGFLLPFSKGLPIIYSHSPLAIKSLLKENQITMMAGVPEFLRVVMTKIEVKAEEEGKKKILDKLMALSSRVKAKFIQRLLFRPVLKKFGGKLHTVVSGGAPLDPVLEKKWDALGIYLLQGYGLTETSPVVATNTYDYHRLGSVGKILPGVEIKIADGDEILVHGPNVFQGYYKNEQKTKEVLTDDGWFQTGDIGRLDGEGFLYLRGRRKYMIKGPGAQNVYPEDIEIELNKISGVKDSCVVGLEKTGGQVEIHAVLLTDKENPAEPPEVVFKANENLASYQHIGGWSIWPEEDFPRSATRKVKKEEVLKWLKQTAPPEARVLEGKTLLIQLLAEITDSPLEKISAETKIVSELNLDSLLRIELVARIEEKFRITVEEAKIDSKTRVSDLAEMIKKGGQIQEMEPLKGWPRSWLATWTRLICQWLFIFPLVRLFVKLKIEGRENLKDLELPVVFMPNHLSFLDSAVVAMAMPFKIRKKIVFAAARDVLYGTYKYFARLAELLFNTFPFPRQEHENIKLGLDYMGRLLDKNWSVIIFPEGKVSLTGELQPLKRGAGLIATQMDSYIVPVKIKGTNIILPPGKIIPCKRGEVKVIFGQPVKFKRNDSYIVTTEKISEALRDI